MAKERSEKSRYKSPSTGEYCTCAQYVAEFVCTRVAQKDNEGMQGHKFWNTPKWKKMYGWQVVLANRLVKKYREEAIVKAINSKECKKMYSLRYPRLPAIIKKYQDQIERNEASMKPIEVPETHTTRTVSFGKKSMINKLRGLDG
jgi:hypothetical protein